MSEDNKNPFSEKTVVQSSRPEPVADDTPKPMSGEKTVVFAQSNLKETFDARTVVRSSKPAPEKTEKPAARLPDEAPPKVLAAELPPGFANQETNPDIRTESVSKVEESLASARAEKKMSQTERRAARAALDRKSRLMMAGFAAVVVMALLCFFVGFGGSKSEKPAKEQADQPQPTKSAELASETEVTPPTKNLQPSGSYRTTTEVLMDFDRAAKRAQDHALEYSR